MPIRGPNPTPFDTDNYIPAKELAGSIVRAGKYLLHLSKWGLAGKKTIAQRYAAKLTATDENPHDQSARRTASLRVAPPSNATATHSMAGRWSRTRASAVVRAFD